MFFKNRRWITIGLALVALVAILAMPACGGFGKAPEDPFDTLRVSIDEQVLDKERVESMKAITGEMELVMNELLENIADQRKALDILITDYGSTESDFRTLFADTLKNRKSNGEKYLALRLKLKETAMDEEWKGIVKAEYEAVAQAARLTIYPSAGE